MTSPEAFLKYLNARYPNLGASGLSINPHLISGQKITLPGQTWTQIQNFVQKIFALRQSAEYRDFLKPQAPFPEQKNYAIAMSYDFHLDANLKPKLIEVNTNASFLFLGHELNQFLQVETPGFSGFTEIAENMRSEIRLLGKPEIKTLAIVDDQPEQQKLYLEFLVAQKVFQDLGWTADIKDRRQILGTENYDFIYNRCTDFYFTEPESAGLKELYVKNKSCLSPHPMEYFMMADKRRMGDWLNPIFTNQLGAAVDVIPKSFVITESNRDQIWTERKKYFLKPTTQFGSKRVYKGESISRKTYELLENNLFLAQELLPAPEVTVETAGGAHKFKYDLRVYAYQGKAQFAMARLYNGQVTNAQTPFGGFAAVEFNRK